MEIWICREGENIGEINKIIQGHQDGELTERGYIQSKLLAFRLSFVKFSEIICSDLDRAKQTAKEILVYHENTQVSFDSIVREKSAGIFEGRTMFDYKSESVKKGLNLREFKPEGGENWNEVLLRASELINGLITKYLKKDFVEAEQINDKETYINSGFKRGILMKMNTITPVVSNRFKKSNSGMISDNTISKGKSETVEMKKMVSKVIDINNNKLESDYVNLDLNSLFNDNNYKKKISKIYGGFNPDLNFPRILVVSHAGFIMEFLNSVRKRKNIRIKFINDSKPTSLYILKIYCINCGVVCYSKDETCRLEYDMIIYNDINHLII